MHLQGVPRTLSSPAYQKLRELLTAARDEAKVTQTELARRLGRPQSFVSKYETGERSLDVIEFVAVCEALGREPVELLEPIRAKAQSAATRGRRLAKPET